MNHLNIIGENVHLLRSFGKGDLLLSGFLDIWPVNFTKLFTPILVFEFYEYGLWGGSAMQTY